MILFAFIYILFVILFLMSIICDQGMLNFGFFFFSIFQVVDSGDPKNWKTSVTLHVNNNRNNLGSFIATKFTLAPDNFGFKQYTVQLVNKLSDNEEKKSTRFLINVNGSDKVRNENWHVKVSTVCHN